MSFKLIIGTLIKGTFIIAILLFFLSLLFFPLYVGIEYGKLPSVTEYWIQYISVFLSSFSFAAVIWTLWLQHKEEKKQQEQIKKNFEFAQQNYDSQILDKIHYFTSDSMTTCRSGACSLWAELESNNSTREKLFNYFIMTITNSETSMDGILNSEFYSNFCSFFKLIRYFNVLSFYSFNNLTANAIHYYYVYYRPFFIQMIEIYNQACDSIDKNNQVATVRENWIYLVEKFDKIMISNHLPLQ